MRYKLTCPTCGSQDFTLVCKGFGGGVDLLECQGWGCGRIWGKDELPFKPKILTLECPLCDADFYGDCAKDWMKRHFEMAHPEVGKVKIVVKRRA